MKEHVNRTQEAEQDITAGTGVENEITIALAGNPNSGKTSLFNNLTGSRQHVGNWPGVTVEKKEGFSSYEETKIKVVDLPGTYSLTAYSIEEVVARDFIVQGNADVVVVVLDASNLERNLYLALQILELDVRVVVALNMMDIVTKAGGTINVPELSQLLNVPVVETVARSNKGTDDLLRVITETARKESRKELIVPYGRIFEGEIEKLTARATGMNIKEPGFTPRWLVVKLLEKDRDVSRKIEKIDGGKELIEEIDNARLRLVALMKDDTETIIADQRYGYISGLIKEVYRRNSDAARRTISDQVDRVVANRVLGFPIFLFFMWLTFQLTFTVGARPVHWIEMFFEYLSHVLSRIPGDSMLESLLVDGVIGGVGGVVVFLPVIVLLFLAIAFLEDSGYMARAAFIMDKIMHNIGLHGKSFIPMLIGFGCSVPAIMATRTLENRKDRIITILIIPLMSCGARLPVYVLLSGAFFSGKYAGHIIFSMYLIGIVLAILAAKVFHVLLFPGKSSPFVMELPPYRLPTFKSIMILMWERSWLYLKKAGTVILAIAIIMWFLVSFPGSYPGMQEKEEALASATTAVEQIQNPSDQDLFRVTNIKNDIERLKLEHSFAGTLGKVMEPVFRPLGFDWRSSIALLAGLAAKEVVVSTLGTIYSMGEADEESQGLRDAMRADPSFNPLKAYVLMLFALISVPCMATLAVIRRETNSWKWPVFSATYHFVLAWVICFVVYQGGRLMGLGG